MEEYFQVSAFEPIVRREDWNSFESRLAIGMHLLLDLLQRYETRATFFVLGWVAERHANLVRDVAAAGHEVASHGWSHERVTHQQPHEFRASVRRTKRLLEDIIGAPVRGFRAPSFSIVPGREWALDVLLEEGYAYDSSLFPVVRPGYGYPSAQADPHWLERPAGRLAEFPPSTLGRAPWRIPAGGGAYFRIFPYALARRAFTECERRGVSGTFYLHPWELDIAQPRLRAGAVARLRHYTGLGRTGPRLERLLSEFQFTTIADGLARM